ncbi:MAG: class I SAM-dependent methyltransferase [Actinobacteria bacterium]|nr:class I SAM-dependent methyltransferase [Cyanobacteriota bacterium]MCL5771845.1 class I SAM-dependent methyltransferase [Actinomycetota bacterium]
MEYLDKNELDYLNYCPICNSKNIKKIGEKNTININSKEIVSLIECNNCKHWFISPLPNQKYLNNLYKVGSEFVVSRGYKGREKPEDTEIKKYVSRFIKYKPNLSELNFLEIGVGPGYYFNYFEKNTKLSYGVDPCSYKPENPNIVEDISLIPENLKFDIILIQDVLEHLENPTDMLSIIKKLANENAILSCGFPNKDCLTAKKMKEKWRMVMPIGHLHYFSKKSVNIMLEKSGWKLKKKHSTWGRPTIIDIIKNFDWGSKNPIKLIYRFFVYLLFKEILFGKDQWYVLGQN